MHPLKSMFFRFSKQLLVVGVLAMLLFGVSLLSNFPGQIEHFYSGGFYLAICKILHPLFNLIPFSLGDICYIGLIASLLYTIYKIIKLSLRRQFGMLFGYLVNASISIQILLLMFYIFWGLNYYRPSAAIRLNLTDTDYTLKDIEAVTIKLIDSANFYRSTLKNYDNTVTNEQIFKHAEEAINQLPACGLPGFKPIRPRIKPSLLTFFLNYIGTEGYYNPFTSESQINYQMPVFLRPVVACHEMSHQMGYATEDEANFVGFVAGIQSSNHFLKYSAYYLGTEELMYAVGSKDTIAFKALKKHISPAVINDFKDSHAYWKNYEGRVAWLSSILYDRYLRANNQPKGLITYNQMVKLVMAWNTKNKPFK